MPTGIVKEYNPERGYGVIVSAETGHKLTVYANYINLKEGEVLKINQEVEFEVERDRNTNTAVNVRILQKNL